MNKKTITTKIFLYELAEKFFKSKNASITMAEVLAKQKNEIAKQQNARRNY